MHINARFHEYDEIWNARVVKSQTEAPWSNGQQVNVYIPMQ